MFEWMRALFYFKQNTNKQHYNIYINNDVVFLFEKK